MFYPGAATEQPADLWQVLSLACGESEPDLLVGRKQCVQRYCIFIA